MIKSTDISSIRHSLAHVMAAAVQKLYPEAKFGVGPVIENGFYYDIAVEHPFGPEDLKVIQKEMKQLIGGKYEFVHEQWSIDEAIQYFKAQKQDFKVELLNDLRTKGSTAVSDTGDIDLVDKNVAKVTTVSVYKTADFTDLCRGPHVENTIELPVNGFKLTKVSGAYWRGDEKNPQMQRIYGVAFTDKSELDKYLQMIQEAEKRDHRKLGRQLDLVTFSPLVGSGLPMFTPRGSILRRQLGEYSLELKKSQGFEEVWVPHMTKKELYETSGHWTKFGDELFLVKSQETSDELVLKPMNCPHHAQIYSSQPRSYRDLPIKYMENTTVYRDEKSGELNGLERVRSITQDDCHSFCTEEQVSEVVAGLIKITSELYATVAMPVQRVHLSFKNDEDGYLGEENLWRQAQETLESLAKQNNLEYIIDEGEAAFYGPKIDFIAKDAIGRETQVATIQLDFVQPERFGLEYIDREGTKKQPVMIHSAILGSIERFLSVYIEHTAGAFPLWLAPEQVRIIPVSDKFNDYGDKVKLQLKEAGLRVGLDCASESLGKRIRNTELMKVPYAIIVGEKEQKDGTVAVRAYAKGDQGTQKTSEFIENATKQVQKREL